jgi:exodeoxyribonuclease III
MQSVVLGGSSNHGQTHVTPAERAALADLEARGLHDVVRDRWPDARIFTY